ncbi:SDR family oxidoreductase [Vibrio sp. SCSIO 43140]|uniref:UDP-glucose 4-epimerase family protein n=1 Tax=Vibrio sp. SCSIO 43140 TaxID=2819100 RepID=UPI0020756DC0|nr:SDR family oxidoreductase [Vibrio sp. SCSIO 43140]USD60238.1 SDR family oxidoreductase [Vibrio sp. SCSIO 43140]
MKIFLTGANGFLGSQINRTLSNKYQMVCFGRTPPKGSCSRFVKGSLEDLDEGNLDLEDIDVVIHCAARVHMMNDSSTEPLAEYRKINVEPTAQLARLAAKQGVKRFIYVSSIKVHGEFTEEKPFCADDIASPQDDYARSKLEAEQELLNVSDELGMEIVIVRPPLIYGPNVKANFAALSRLANKGLPLPFGCINKNDRSMVSTYNMVDFIDTCITHPQAANQAFLVSDDDDVSTKHLIQLLSEVQGKRAILLPIPEALFIIAGKVLGKSDVVDRLLGSLRIDIQKNSSLLGWTPPYSLRESLLRMIKESN